MFLAHGLGDIVYHGRYVLIFLLQFGMLSLLEKVPLPADKNVYSVICRVEYSISVGYNP